MSGGEEVGELEEILADGRAHIGQSKVVQKVVTDLKVLILLLTLLHSGMTLHCKLQFKKQTKQQCLKIIV